MMGESIVAGKGPGSLEEELEDQGPAQAACPQEESRTLLRLPPPQLAGGSPLQGRGAQARDPPINPFLPSALQRRKPR